MNTSSLLLSPYSPSKSGIIAVVILRGGDDGSGGRSSSSSRGGGEVEEEVGNKSYHPFCDAEVIIAMTYGSRSNCGGGMSSSSSRSRSRSRSRSSSSSSSSSSTYSTGHSSLSTESHHRPKHCTLMDLPDDDHDHDDVDGIMERSVQGGKEREKGSGGYVMDHHSLNRRWWWW